jgi:hypothetical protein
MAMEEKEIRIFDTSNAVLKVTGIRFELFNAATGALIAIDNSRDLNPGSNEWGVKLPFAAGSDPLEVYTTDPTYSYPGNAIVSLEGNQTDRIDIDLHKIPAGRGGQATPLTSSSPLVVSGWIRRAPEWSKDEKLAVVNLVLNYMRLVAEIDQLPESKMYNVAKNWEEALRRLGISPDTLRG